MPCRCYGISLGNNICLGVTITDKSVETPDSKETESANYRASSPSVFGLKLGRLAIGVTDFNEKEDR
ncbi:hypothetical protein BGZ58_009610, partial [Dissophora ornata]